MLSAIKYLFLWYIINLLVVYGLIGLKFRNPHLKDPHQFLSYKMPARAIWMQHAWVAHQILLPYPVNTYLLKLEW